jgi:hypothetical protein
MGPSRSLDLGFAAGGKYWPGQGRFMKTFAEVLQEKEEAIARVKKEIEALKFVANLIAEEQDKTEHKSEYRQLLQMP